MSLDYIIFECLSCDLALEIKHGSFVHLLCWAIIDVLSGWGTRYSKIYLSANILMKIFIFCAELRMHAMREVQATGVMVRVCGVSYFQRQILFLTVHCFKM